ncbi:uncharacterized protein LOC34621072 [Cyclospora cayetanensis]|uniref:Uncharacterized protein LOC34621072 n=1 Tax=Cyclospora cayetanensis TaxID=88456 RepID=A0A6P5WCT4_9EIME|nr:uncharacterized protein LOC34621072 [Cyclospora cayetanensis]
MATQAANSVLPRSALRTINALQLDHDRLSETSKNDYSFRSNSADHIALFSDHILIRRSAMGLQGGGMHCKHLKVSLLGTHHKVTLALFCKLLTGQSPPLEVLREPVGVEWGLRRLNQQGTDIRMTVWALSVAEAFSELRVELCRESHALLLIVDAGIEGSTPVSEQLQQLQVLRDSCVKALQPNRQPEVLLVAAGGDGPAWAKAAIACRRFASTHRCRFLEVQPVSTAGTESLLRLLSASNSAIADPKAGIF